MNKVFLINAFTQKIEALYLDSLTSSHCEIIESAREYGEVVGKIGNDLLIKMVNNESLSITVNGSEEYKGCIFIVSNIKVNSSTSLHIPLFCSISFNVSLIKALYRLARNSCYELNDSILYNNDKESISIRELIVNLNKMSNRDKLKLYYKIHAHNEIFYSEKELFTFGRLINEVLE